MQLIGINGFKRSGKGETGQAIFDFHEGVVYQVGFADKLKIMAAKALGFDRPPRDLIALMDEMKETATISISYCEPGTATALLHDLTVREYLQNFGNDARELFGDTFWIDQVLPNPSTYDRVLDEQKLAQRYTDVDCVAITDLRYPNEAERVFDLGGEVWEIVRPGVVSDGHASELPLPRELVTRTIINDSDVEALRIKVANLLVSDEELENETC